jgi:hypothetical protein
LTRCTSKEAVVRTVAWKRRRSVLMGIAAVLSAVGAACDGAGPRSLDTLVQREGRYLDPEDFRPYTGLVVTMYRDAPDAIEMSARLVDGRLDGPYERFYRDGALFGVGTYRAGAWEGPFESFYRDGTLWMRGRYEGGVLDGPYVAYAEDGSVQEEGVYAAGAPCGRWVIDGEEEAHPACP